MTRKEYLVLARKLKEAHFEISGVGWFLLGNSDVATVLQHLFEKDYKALREFYEQLYKKSGLWQSHGDHGDGI